MRKSNTLIAFAILLSILTSCNNQETAFDASGAFEADETIISAQSNGIIGLFDVEEGQQLKAGQQIGFIDSTQIFLKKKQLESQIDAVLSRKPNVSVQLAALQTQLATAENERNRIKNLLAGDAATPKQLDDANASIETIQRQIDAQRSNLMISSESIGKETAPLKVQIDQINDQLSKCRIINPINGTVLTKFAEANEMATVGKVLYTIADLSTITLRVYVTGDQLPTIKLNQKVKVLTDDGKGGYNEHQGVISWINDKAEFTPKTILTKNERENLVYAVKVKVKNDGYLKIGMYGEISFN